MPTVLNKTERLIHTHDGVMIPPGVPTDISDEALANETIAQAITDGMLENTTAPIGTRAQSDQQQPNANPQRPAQPAQQPTPNPNKAS